MKTIKSVGYELNGNENDFIKFLNNKGLEFEIFEGTLNDAIFVDYSGGGFTKNGEHYERMALIPEFLNSWQNRMIIHLTDDIEWYNKIKKEWSEEQE